MALVKVIRVGDELIFDLREVADDAKPEISVNLVEKAGRMAVLKITAHRSIPIIHNKRVNLSEVQK